VGRQDGSGFVQPAADRRKASRIADVTRGLRKDGAPAGPGSQVGFLPDDGQRLRGALPARTAPGLPLVLGQGAARSRCAHGDRPHEGGLPGSGPCCSIQRVSRGPRARIQAPIAVDWPLPASRAREKVQLPSAWVVGRHRWRRMAGGATRGPKPLRAASSRGLRRSRDRWLGGWWSCVNAIRTAEGAG